MSRSLFIGAGFSVGAGLPLAADLYLLVREAIRRQYGQDNHFERDLNRFIKFQLRCDNRVIDPGQVDLEEFLGFLDAEHFLGLKGKDTWSSDGNETQLMIRSAIARILLAATPSRLPDTYVAFARALSLNDWIYSFNYDTVIEQALDSAGIPYRLFPDRYTAVYPLSCTVDNSVDEVVVLKMHGSIDWFDRRSYDDLCAVVPGHPPEHPIFGPQALVAAAPLVEGPRQNDDPLNGVVRVRELHSIIDQPFWQCCPLILAPSSSKLLYSRPLRPFWRGLQRIGGLDLNVGVVGYSLPPNDPYAQQAIYHVARNYQHYEPDLEFEGKRKTPFRVLDFRESPDAKAALRERYRFLDWSRSEVWTEGLSEQSVQWLFRD